MHNFENYIKGEAFPNGFTSINNIKQDRTIRRQILKIREKPETQVVKEAIWIEYLKHQHERGLLTSNEYMDLRDWKIKW